MLILTALPGIVFLVTLLRSDSANVKIMEVSLVISQSTYTIDINQDKNKIPSIGSNLCLNLTNVEIERPNFSF